MTLSEIVKDCVFQLKARWRRLYGEASSLQTKTCSMVRSCFSLFLCLYQTWVQFTLPIPVHF